MPKASKRLDRDWSKHVIDAEVLLRAVTNEPLTTVRGQTNTVLSVASGQAQVATSRSPAGQAVPIAWLQSVFDRLMAGEAVDIEPISVGYRSAFLGAILRVLPQVEILEDSPPRARLRPDVDTSLAVMAELGTTG